MPLLPLKITAAWWTTRFDGIVTLSRDWEDDAATPPFELAPPARLRRVERLAPRRWARLSGYWVEDGRAHFALWPALHPNLVWQEEDIRVAGAFNDWRPDERWRLLPEGDDDGGADAANTAPAEREPLLCCVAPVVLPARAEFKFVTTGGVWLDVPAQAPNRVRDEHGNSNRLFDAARSGRHVFRFSAETPASLTEPEQLFLRTANTATNTAGGATAGAGVESIAVADGDFLLCQESPLEMGARIRDGKTVFRLFAPRATRVLLELQTATGAAGGDGTGTAERLPLRSAGGGVWERVFDRPLAGARYRYFVEGANTAAAGDTAFDPSAPLLDPWALAAAGPAGPAIVVDDSPPVPAVPVPPPPATTSAAPAPPFVPPAPQDAVIVEAHLRDLLGGDGSAGGFRELAAWLRSPGNYLRRLGANVLELLPVTEFERGAAAEYHWGYMPVNWFAPASAYASNPAAASQVAEFRDLVDAAHAAGIAVVLDVVYNHTGNPNPLLLLDKGYFLETDAAGALTNWSGCGCDTRPAAPMLRRLVLDSLRHWVRAYGVDGFRLDLAELLGLPLLREIERELRALNPRLLLIAEPWSFRGHIGARLARTTTYSVWNDAFREFLPDYTRGTGNAAGLRWFLAGSPAAGAAPAWSVNYTESHDDRCWLDRITENAGNDGANPTPADACRTRLMAAILLASRGTPMLAAGQDFLRTKRGVSNTYRRGDLNALDYTRLERFRDTHDYVRAWIAFRLSANGAALRATTGEIRFHEAADGTAALAALYPAPPATPDAPPAPPLLFAVNPAAAPATFHIPPPPELAPFPPLSRWTRLCDADRFFAAAGTTGATGAAATTGASSVPPIHGRSGAAATAPTAAFTLTLPPCSLGLWMPPPAVPEQPAP
ncbi:MAG: hypothetical protein LBR07_08195 [Puniceicoccales bacterium]|jgi:pullulanase/glycogen debranching enzyme|nr:hypothetical protein [Puniceicoccales bacterium]